MPKTRWRFINSTKPSDVIVIHDQWSAEVLSRVLKGEVQGPWGMQVEERGEETAASRVRVPIRPAQRRGSGQPPAAVPDAPGVPEGSGVPEVPVTPETPVAPEAPGVPARSSKRFKVRLHVVVVCGAQTFNSNTRDVSEGGLALEEKIPDCFFGQYCRIYVYRSMNGERIDLKCRIFPDPRNPRRLQFVDPPSEVLQRLKEWVETLDAAGDRTDVA